MSGNLYNRFIDAFKDENETIPGTNEKRPPLKSDEKLEDTFKTLQNTIKNINPTKNEEEEKKSSRFQRWIMHYLKAPFQKWEKKTNDEQINLNIEDKNKEKEEENIELDSSSDTDEDEDEAGREEHFSITEKLKERLETFKNLGKNLKDKVCFYD